MFNGTTSNLHWSRAPIVLYDQSSLNRQDASHSRLCSEEQAATFAGAFSIRSILSHSRPQADIGAVHQSQDPRYLNRIPASCAYSQPQAGCCDEGTISPIHLQATVNALNQGSVGSLRETSRTCDIATFESTKVSGCLGSQSSIGKARPRRGNKRSRTIFTPFQLQRLEKAFDRQQYVAGEERRQLATGLNLSETQVKVWFQNRRIRFRKQRVKAPVP